MQKSCRKINNYAKILSDIDFSISDILVCTATVGKISGALSQYTFSFLHLCIYQFPLIVFL